MRLYQWIINLLFPPRCVLCGKLLGKEELDLCKMCGSEAVSYRTRKINLPFLDSFTAVWYYEGNVRRSLLRFKFRGARSYASAYGRKLAMKVLEEYPEGFDVLTWVPVSPLRRFRRGYDQGALLAKAVGKELGMIQVSALKKVRHNPAQSGIHGETARKENVRDAYRLRPGVWVAEQRVLLLDDIFTTGATAAEAARVLRAAGAKEVHCAAVAAARKE